MHLRQRAFGAINSIGCATICMRRALRIREAQTHSFPADECTGTNAAAQLRAVPAYRMSSA